MLVYIWYFESQHFIRVTLSYSSASLYSGTHHLRRVPLNYSLEYRATLRYFFIYCIPEHFSFSSLSLILEYSTLLG